MHTQNQRTYAVLDSVAPLNCIVPVTQCAQSLNTIFMSSHYVVYNGLKGNHLKSFRYNNNANELTHLMLSVITTMHNVQRAFQD
jgi:hypothetical protein